MRRDLEQKSSFPDSHSLTQRIIALTLLLFIMTAASACVRHVGTSRDTGLILETPLQPADVREQALAPGLAVRYFYDFYRHISNMPQGKKMYTRGRPGPPIPLLNHRFGPDVEVFDSGQSKGVGMVLDGFLHLEPGTYIFQAKTNDGFTLSINDTLLISDPGVHGDRLSAPGTLTVARGGWFPVQIKYFQRKGTAALALSWKPPGSTEFSVVPAEVYAHLADN